MTMLGAGLAGCPETKRDTTPKPLSAKQIVEQSKPAIVRVEVGNDRMGTGFVIDGAGVIATNLHVVYGADQINVRTLDGSVLPVGHVVAIDPNHDLALIAVTPPKPLPTLALGDSDQVAAGDPVLAIGNPLGVLDYTVSDGLISSVREVGPDVKLLQISAPISQGSSGGPLFNPFGEVIGVSTAIFTEGQNLNFGVPSNYVKALAAARDPITVQQFAALTRRSTDVVAGNGVKIVREVPSHPLVIFDGCDDASITEAVGAIHDAIELGAPLYNQGNHEACFRIYEGASSKLERESSCRGVREAFGAGLLRASTLDNATLRAWALRDTFDGIVDVALRFKQAREAAEASGKGGGAGSGSGAKPDTSKPPKRP